MVSKRIKSGDRVKVISGRYAGFVGGVTKIDSHGNCKIVRREGSSEWEAICHIDDVEKQ